MLASNQNQQGRILNTTNSGAHPKLNQYLEVEPKDGYI